MLDMAHPAQGKFTEDFGLLILVAVTGCASGPGDARAGRDDGTEGGTPSVDGNGQQTEGAFVREWLPRLPPDLRGCVVVDGRPNGLSPDRPTYTRRSYDAERRLVTDLPLATIDSDVLSDTGALYQRLDEEGRLLLKAGITNRPFRHEYQRDETGNVTSFHFTYDSELNLELEPFGELYMASEYANEYDDRGLLDAHAALSGMPSLPDSFTYQHDASGRCESIASSGGSTERRAYDANGRLHRVTVTGEQTFAGNSNHVLVYNYDGQGRTSYIDRFEGLAGEDLLIDDSPDVHEVFSYADDGSVLIETFSLGVPVEDGVLHMPGEVPMVHHYRLRSAGCQELDASLPTPRDQRCVAD